MLGSDPQVWLRVQREMNAATRDHALYMPVSEERSVYIAQELCQQQTVDAQFLSSSCDRLGNKKQFISSTAYWDKLNVLCASGVISSGLSYKKDNYKTIINMAGNQACPSWDEAQKQVRPRPPPLKFYFQLRTRGGYHAPALQMEDFETLSRLTTEQLQARGFHIPLLHPEMFEFRRLAELYVLIKGLIAHDVRNYRANYIRLLHTRRATIRFLAPLPDAVPQHVIDTSKRFTRAQRLMDAVLNAPAVCKARIAWWSSSDGKKDIHQPAFDRYSLCVKYGLANQNGDALKQAAKNEYMHKLSSRIERLHAMLRVNGVEERDKREAVEQPPHLRQHLVLRQDMCNAVLRLLNLSIEQLLSLQEFEFSTVDVPVEEVEALLESQGYKVLHKLDPVAFPTYGKSISDERKTVNFFKAFFKARAIPLLRTQREVRTEGKKKRKISVYTLDTHELSTVMLPKRPPVVKTVCVRSFVRRKDHYIDITSVSDEVFTVPAFLHPQKRIYFIAARDESYKHCGRKWEWALFLRGAVVKVECPFDLELLTEVPFVACNPLVIQINLTDGTLADISPYVHGQPVTPVHLQQPYVIENFLHI